jgi:hypothetical protein
MVLCFLKKQQRKRLFMKNTKYVLSAVVTLAVFVLVILVAADHNHDHELKAHKVALAELTSKYEALRVVQVLTSRDHWYFNLDERDYEFYGVNGTVFSEVKRKGQSVDFQIQPFTWVGERPKAELEVRSPGHRDERRYDLKVRFRPLSQVKNEGRLLNELVAIEVVP